jgi:hypothetical protein
VRRVGQVRSWAPTGPLTGFVCLLALLGVLAATTGLDGSGWLAGVTSGGGRAPDARGLTCQAVSDPIRMYALLGLDHTTLLYAGNAAGADHVAGLGAAADGVVQSCARRENPGGRRRHW